MTAIPAPVIRMITLFLAAAAVTVGVPALFPSKKVRKHFFLGWITAAAGACVPFLLAEYGGTVGKTLLIAAVLLLLLWGNSIVQKYLEAMKTEKGQSAMKGALAGCFSGILIYIGAAKYLPLPKPAAFGDLVPALILLTVYCLINGLLYRYL